MSRKLLFATMASMLMFDANASTVLTSQTYVDGVAAEKVDIAQGVGTNNANVGKTLVVNSSGNLELGTIAAGNFIEDSITDGVTNKAPSENAVYDALADKQDIIPARAQTAAASVLTDSTTDGVLQKRAILDTQTYDAAYSWDDLTSIDIADMIPDAGTVSSVIIDAINDNIVPFTWDNTTDTAAVNNYSTTFNGTTNNWPSNQSGQYVMSNALAKGLALKQNKIPAGTNPNTVNPTMISGSVLTYTNSAGVVGEKHIIEGQTFDELTDGQYDGESAESSLRNMLVTAGDVASNINRKQDKIPAGTAGNIVTYTGTAGSVGSVATAGAPTYDNSGELTNDTSIPTMGAVVNQRAHFGTSTTAKATATKEVSIPDLTALNEGLILVITPTITSTAGDSSLQVTGANNVVLGTHQMKYHNVALTDTTDGYVWVANTPALWIFHDNAWHFIAYGKYDSNTTYAAMSVAEGIAGTAENARSMYASRLKEIIQGTTLTGLDTTDATTVVATDSITTGIGKLQAQITDVAGDVPTLPTGTSGNVVTYNSNGAIGGSVATYDGSTTYNASTDAGKIATAAAVDTKQNKMTCTRWFDNTEHTDANCLLWSIAN